MPFLRSTRAFLGLKRVAKLMGEVVLVRHGQANSAAQTEDEYDRLSELGRQQSRWLGVWIAEQEQQFDQVLRGSLERHQQTAEEMGFGHARVDARLNEMDYFNLGAALEERHGIPMPGPDDFADHAPQVMEAWHRAEIKGNETFAEFESRVTSVLSEAAIEGNRVLCITSGGVIGMCVRHLLGLDPARMARILLPILNSSIHRIHVTRHGNFLAGFNATPHLEHPERAHARTHY